MLSIRHLRKALNVSCKCKKRLLAQPTKTQMTTIVLVTVVIVIAVLYFFSIPQTYFDPLYIKLRSRCESCVKAKAVAIEDFKKGNYQVVDWGLSSSESPTIEIAEILERKYKIKTVFGGCIRQDAIECYDNQMSIRTSKKEQPITQPIAKMAGDVYSRNFLHLTKFCARRQ